MSEGISVLLVEDDEILRKSLERYLALSGFDVVAVPDGLSYYRSLAERPFVVAVIDLGLPDQDGEVLVEYTRRNTSTGIVIITARDTLTTRVGGYRSGADLFLAKPVIGRELEAAIRSLAGRQEARSQGAAPDRAPEGALREPAAGTWALVRGQRTLLAPGGRRIELTARQFQFLEILARAAGETVDRAQMLQEIYGGQEESARHALDTLANRTRQRLEEAVGEEPPIHTQHGVGYSFTAPFVVR